MSSAKSALDAAGADVVEVALPQDFGKLADLNRTIMTYEGLRSLACEIRDSEDLLSDPLKEAMWPAREMEYPEYLAALNLRTRLRFEFDALVADYDALLVPSATGEAPKGFATTGNSVFNAPWTTLGAPCVTLPFGSGSHGLPIGVQLVGGRDHDDHLLQVARWAEDLLANQ